MSPASCRSTTSGVASDASADAGADARQQHLARCRQPQPPKRHAELSRHRPGSLALVRTRKHRIDHHAMPGGRCQPRFAKQFRVDARLRTPACRPRARACASPPRPASPCARHRSAGARRPEMARCRRRERRRASICRCPTNRQRRPCAAPPDRGSGAPRQRTPAPPRAFPPLHRCPHAAACRPPPAPARRRATQAQRHGRQALEVEIAGRPPQVAVEHKICAQPPAPALEVHQQKGEVVEQIDGGERLVELDGVEQHRLPLPEHDVVEVQVAVHAPHTACCRAPRKAGARTGELGPWLPARRPVDPTRQKSPRAGQTPRPAARPRPLAAPPSRRPARWGRARARQRPPRPPPSPRPGPARQPRPLPPAGPPGRRHACAPPTRRGSRCRRWQAGHPPRA